MPHIIIRWKPSHGRRRSEIEENLRKEGWGTSLTEEQIDKCKFVEKRAKEKYGLSESFIKTTTIDKVKSGKKN